jgi:SAM-dependent methyltransferase
MSRSRFDAVALQYDAGRPGYPDEIFDAIEELSGSFLAGALVADVGAGTGISTRALLRRGAAVVAIDHGTNMLAALRARTPAAAVVLADANQLPLRSGAVDLVTFAQSWHWVDLGRAPAEVTRVLRPGGALAVWWNTADDGAERWFDEHRARLREASGHGDVTKRFEAAWASLPSAFGPLDVETTRVHWVRSVAREVILDEVRSKSYVDELGPHQSAAFVERERELLPDAELRQPFVTRLAVVRVGD